MLLIVSLHNPLVSIFGDTGAEQVLSTAKNYASKLAERGIAATLVLPDDAMSMAAFGFDPIPALTPAALAQGIRILQGKFSGNITAVLLLGGDRIIPFWRIINPVASRTVDPDALVLSDNPYGADTDLYASWLAPQLSVGRIPDPGSNSPQDFIALIDAALANHFERPQTVGSCAVINEEWRDVSFRAASAMPGPIEWHFAPGYSVRSDNTGDLSRRWIFFNLHGFDDDPAWHGYDPSTDRFSPALTPASFHSKSISGATVFCANCYGAHITGKTPSNSCALLALREGAASFVGATGLAFGSFLNPGTFPINSDRLATLFFEQMTFGFNAGAALQSARMSYLNDVDSDNPFEQKTALQFTLLGDPTLF